MFKCSYGYFDIQNNEFVITDMKTRRMLKNYLWNLNDQIALTEEIQHELEEMYG